MGDAAAAQRWRCGLPGAERDEFENAQRRLSQYPSLSRTGPHCIARKVGKKHLNFHEILLFEIRMSYWQRRAVLSSVHTHTAT